MKLLLSYFLIVFGFVLTFNVEAKEDLVGFMNALEKAKNAGLTIDADTTAKQFGYKNFNEFFIHFKKENELSDLTIEDAKEFLLGSDNTVNIVESQENLDKLYDLVMNNKFFVKYQKKKNSYLNVFKKGKYKKDKIDQMALAVYIDYEKEMSKISKNPNLENITRFAWDWGYTWGSGYTPFEWALKGCRKEAKKYKLSGGECIIIDYRSKNPDKTVNYLKPKLKNVIKKKTLVTQKKIKIKKKSLDIEPPIIDIKDTFVVKSSNLEINGKVSDKGSKLVYVKVAGQDTPNNFTIFSASQKNQISSGFKEVNHGIFSYYLMKGLEGNADSNKDKKITNGELLAYMDQNVSQKASELGRQQNPSLAGDPNKVLMSYR